jgi:hypothetical protein
MGAEQESIEISAIVTIVPVELSRAMCRGLLCKPLAHGLLCRKLPRVRRFSLSIL